jgi:heat shock protein HslJ/uncharacterized lipoprotein YbaY
MVIMAYAMMTAYKGEFSNQDIRPEEFITIINPIQGDNLDLTWAVNVSGEAGGLGNDELFIQVIDASGDILAQQPTTLYYSNAGTNGSGSWSVNLRFEAPLGSQGQIVAFAISSIDGSKIAEDKIEVGFGEDPFRQELVDVENHLWNLAELNDRPIIDSTTLTLEFDNFKANGFGGCNSYRTSFERSGRQLNFGFVTSTAKECELPPGIMTQESAYFNALEQITTFQINENQFLLMDYAGVERLEYNAVVMGIILKADEDQLPQDSVIVVQLKEVPNGKLDGQLITEKQYEDITQLPIAFSLVYNPKQITEYQVYHIDVQIENATGSPLFYTPSPPQVITIGNPSDVIVRIDQVE